MNTHRSYTYSRRMERHPTVLSELELCYAAALLEALRLIDAKAKELHVEPEFDAIPLQTYVKQKGDWLVYITGLSKNAERPTPNTEHLTGAQRKAA